MRRGRRGAAPRARARLTLKWLFHKYLHKLQIYYEANASYKQIENFNQIEGASKSNTTEMKNNKPKDLSITVTKLQLARALIGHEPSTRYINKWLRYDYTTVQARSNSTKTSQLKINVNTTQLRWAKENAAGDEAPRHYTVL